MAGSVFRPLTNIPYCCLPQESGPCLSTSVGDRPLRSPSHRRLGGPSPRRPSTGTHARPPPRLRLAPREMPPMGNIRHYPAFPPAIPGRGVGCIRVTHPSATLNPPKGTLPFDLHVLGLPLAFILSQDQTLRCSIVVLVSSSESRVPLSFSLCSFSRVRFPSTRLTRTVFLVLASSFQRTSLNLFHNLAFPSRLAGAKVQLFSLHTTLFFDFLKLFYIILIIKYLKTTIFSKKHNNQDM